MDTWAKHMDKYISNEGTVTITVIRELTVFSASLVTALSSRSGSFSL